MKKIRRNIQLTGKEKEVDVTNWWQFFLNIRVNCQLNSSFEFLFLLLNQVPFNLIISLFLSFTIQFFSSSLYFHFSFSSYFFRLHLLVKWIRKPFVIFLLNCVDFMPSIDGNCSHQLIDQQFTSILIQLNNKSKSIITF